MFVFSRKWFSTTLSEREHVDNSVFEFSYLIHIQQMASYVTPKRDLTSLTNQIMHRKKFLKLKEQTNEQDTLMGPF